MCQYVNSLSSPSFSETGNYVVSYIDAVGIVKSLRHKKEYNLISSIIERSGTEVNTRQKNVSDRFFSLTSHPRPECPSSLQIPILVIWPLKSAWHDMIDYRAGSDSFLSAAAMHCKNKRMLSLTKLLEDIVVYRILYHDLLLAQTSYFANRYSCCSHRHTINMVERHKGSVCDFVV